MVWDLEPAPYGDLFQDSAEQARSLAVHPLTLGLCGHCGLVQLVGEVDTQAIHGDYLYQTRVNPGLVSYFNRLGLDRVRTMGLTADDLVVDVGANDGTALVAHRNAGVRVVGIEPAHRPAAVARSRGVPMIEAYLDESAVSAVHREFGPARLVTAHYVAANVHDPIAFLSDLATLASPDGIVSVITGYHPDQFECRMFDYISHDHLSYFSVASLSRLATATGLTVCSVERIAHKGGSIRVDMRRAGPGVRPDESVGLHLQQERWRSVDRSSYYTGFAETIAQTGRQVRELVDRLSDRPIPGIGASISTTHLLRQFALNESISALYDDDPRKTGLHAPGSGLSVRLIDALAEEDRGELVILLSWQVTAILLERLREVGYQGTVLIPLPEPALITLP